MSNDKELEKTVNTIADFQHACEKYLRESGWKAEWPYWVVPKRFGIFTGDKLFLKNALDMQWKADAERFRK